MDKIFLRFASDLHIEFTSDLNYIDSLIPPMDTDKDTVLALLGDIHVGIGAIPFIEEIATRFKAIIYIIGNHEYYNNNFYSLKDTMYHTFKEIKNVHLLDNESVLIDGQKFIGSTLWTDFYGEQSHCMLNVSKGLNDYHLIEGFDGKKLTTEETLDVHKRSIEYLRNNVDRDSIVLTHHAPLIGLSDPQFKHSPIGSGFESDLMDLIFKLQPKYWLYGHTHYNRGIVEVENTKLLSNQCGYIHEMINSYDPRMMINLT